MVSLMLKMPGRMESCASLRAGPSLTAMAIANSRPSVAPEPPSKKKALNIVREASVPSNAEPHGENRAAA